jgi:radical SAM protein with 4Fe4S-binding SPASM domain
VASPKVPLPTYLQLEVAGQCNLRCQMCPIQFRKDGPPHGPPAFMSWETFMKVLDQFPDLKELHLQGLGEPMLHPRFFDMVGFAAARGIRVTTNTNMTLVTRARAERCATSGLDCLHVSVDGSTAATYEGIRAKGRFDRVVRNIENVVEARERLKSPLPRLRLVMVIMRRNLHELPDLVRLARGWSMESIFVQHLCHDFAESTLPDEYRPMREFVDEETLLGEDLSKVERYFEEARTVARELNIELRLPRPRPKEHPPGTSGRERCNWPWTGAYVSYQGYAMPCCMVSTPDRIHFGNMAERGVRAVWESDGFQEFRHRLESGDPHEICRSCAVYNGTF